MHKICLRILACAVAVAGAMILMSCSGRNGYRETLAAEESFIGERPDSAMAVVQQIDPENIHGKEYRYKKESQAFLLLALSAVYLAIIIFFYYRKRIVEKDLQLVGYVDLAESLKRAVDEKDMKLSDVVAQKNALSTRVDEMSGQVASLFSGQYELFDRLIKAYYETSSFGGDRDSIYRQVCSEISRFSKDRETIAELERIINKYRNNVMAYVKAEMPRLSERDIRLLCYIYAGFSVKSMSVLTGETIHNVMMRKSRLKNRMLTVNPPHVRIMIDEMP